ncbi:hypothetical protein ACFZ8E_19015 [Methylobacterium sp. HMF5984]|uniref:hypothetical protein n=1 Tax=Methylobacterium sp. HMF5984 TaxID=3367370 RepID=UPI003854945B
MNGDDKPEAPFFRVRAGRNGSREYFAPDWKPGDPPSYVILREQPRDRRVAAKANGRPRALSDNEALQVIVAAHKVELRAPFVDEETAHVNVSGLAQEIAMRIFGKASPIERNEHVRQLIRRLGLAK